MLARRPPGRLDSCIHDRENEPEVSPNCALCKDLTAHRIQPFLYYHVKDAADGGCPFCNCISKTLEHFFELGGDALESKPDNVIDMGISDGYPLTLKYRGHEVMLYTPPRSEQTSLKIGYAEEITPSGGSEEAFARAAEWLNECLEQHDECRQSIKPELPRRVVDIGANNDELRLWEPTPFDPTNSEAAYAALSHCWGKYQPLTTTTSTLSLRKERLEWSALPATFQDAITVTRRLGLRFIWIDSLCIIQDDEHDWAVESAKMGLIYANAYIVIAASSSPDGTHSFLAARQTPYAHPLEFTIERSDGVFCTVKGRPVISTAMRYEPLDKRGWTFQEHRLARRLLRYTGPELVWQCRSTSYLCECEATEHRSIRQLTQTANDGPDCVAIPESTADPKKLYHQWQVMLGTYTKRSLTKPSDKLPAMAGIAAMIQKATGSDYLAGLWVDNILDDLTWQVEKQDTIGNIYTARTESEVWGFSRLRAPSEYRAPSFSWASIDGVAVRYSSTDLPNHEPTSLDDDEDDDDEEREGGDVVVVKFAGAAPKIPGYFLGEVTNAELVLEGAVVEAQVTVAYVRSCETYRTNGIFGSFQICREGMEATMDADLPIVEGVGVTEEQEVVSTLRRATTGDDTKSPLTGTVTCLAFWRGRRGVSALVLGRSARVPGAYERLGWMFYDGDEERGIVSLAWFFLNENRDLDIVDVKLV